MIQRGLSVACLSSRFFGGFADARPLPHSNAPFRGAFPTQHMPLTSILGFGAIVLVSLVSAAVRLGSSSKPERKLAPAEPAPEGKIAGVELKLLLSERSGTGALLRENLAVRSEPKSR